ncbi:MAG: SemiSWEET transporter [Halobacteriales archaeon]|nr:SemiSWEET transporter [Halobacteriales archaeon]
MDPWVSALGLVAGTLTTGAFVPQVVKAWRTRQMTDVSPLMIVVMLTGLVLWIGYGLFLQDAVIIVANAVGVGLTTMLLGLWWKYRQRAPQV